MNKDQNTNIKGDAEGDGIIFKITYPNKKIYIGYDHFVGEKKLNNNLAYCGSPTSPAIKDDFNSYKQGEVFTIEKEILEALYSVTKKEITDKKNYHIDKHKANNPEFGYNRTPKFDFK